jgi:cobalt-zinc-cadmium efflux system outer membrane protein
MKGFKKNLNSWRALRRLAPVLAAALLWAGTSAAQPVLTLEEAVAAARQNHPAVRAAALATEQARQSERGAVLLPQPEVSVENPEGERFTVGVDQTFEWPGVYRAERALARQQTALTGLQQAVTANELAYQVRQIYLEWQYAQARLAWYAVQDTVYRAVRNAADRQFQAGEIDFVQKTYAETQYASQQLALLEARADDRTAWQRLQLLTGLEGPRLPAEALAEAGGSLPPVVTPANPSLAVAQAAIERENLNVRAAEQRNRPGFSVGYFNQAGPDNPWYNRFRAGITLPVWQRAYRRRLEAARTGVAVAEQQLSAQRLDLEVQQREAAGDLEKWQASLAFFRQTAQPRAAELRDSARRFFDAGQISFTDYLRIVADANQLELAYLEALFEFNQAVNRIHYLNGG